MKTLETIQKTWGIFKILSKIAMILSFVWAGLAAFGLVCGLVWMGGGTVVGADLETLLTLTGSAGLSHMVGQLLSEIVSGLTDGILFWFALRYFRAELADGTPFTARGSDMVRHLGISVIVMPMVAAIISAVISGCFNLESSADNGASVTFGIALILFSLVLRHGAELRK